MKVGCGMKVEVTGDLLSTVEGGIRENRKDSILIIAQKTTANRDRTTEQKHDQEQRSLHLSIK
jgi:hypothetical protein